RRGSTQTLQSQSQPVPKTDNLAEVWSDSRRGHRSLRGANLFPLVGPRRRGSSDRSVAAANRRLRRSDVCEWAGPQPRREGPSQRRWPLQATPPRVDELLKGRAPQI